MSLSLLDPRIKLLILIGISTAALVLRRPAALLMLLAMTLLILLIGGVTPGTIWLKLRGLFGLIATLFLLQCLFERSGTSLLSVFGLTLVTGPGFQTAVLVCLRLLVVILSALVIAVGETRDYLLAMTQCKVPYDIAFMVLTALRFLPMLKEEAKEVLYAAQMRGMRLKKTGLRRQIGAYISMVLPVVAGAVGRAEELSIAMEARGFRAYPRRTSMRRLYMRAEDWAYLTVFILALSAIFMFSAAIRG